MVNGKIHMKNALSYLKILLVVFVEEKSNRTERRELRILKEKRK